MKKILLFFASVLILGANAQVKITTTHYDTIPYNYENLKMEMPDFRKYEPSEFSKNSRYLIIEYGQGNKLVRESSKRKSLTWKKAHHLNAKSTLMVIAKAFDSEKLDSMTVEINGSDYNYEKGIAEIYKDLDLSPKANEKDQGTTEEKAVPESSISDSSKVDTIEVVVIKNLNDSSIVFLDEYLETLLYRLDLYSVSFANARNLALLDQFKISLKKKIQALIDAGYEIQATEQLLYDHIQNWQFLYTPLMPIAERIPENDKITVVVKNLEKDKTTTTYRPQVFRTAGLLGFSLTTNLFVTGLVNDDVYADSVQIDTSYKELRAEVNKGQSKIAVGIGFNSALEISTGTVFTPSLNIGFFVPFEQEVSPRIAIGPGISLGNSRVKFNVNAGLAIGEVNVISKKYQGKDLSQYDQGIDLSEKVWKKSWQVGLGLSYNIVKQGASKDEN